MIYQSTRNDELEVRSAQAIVAGLAPDGGLFIPKEKPQISIDDIKRLADMNYKGRACGVLSLFLSDYTSEEIENCVDKAYSKEKFETESIAPLYGLNDDEYILELWHGPTCAFKDMALQILPHLMRVSAQKTVDGKEYKVTPEVADTVFGRIDESRLPEGYSKGWAVNSSSTTVDLCCRIPKGAELYSDRFGDGRYLEEDERLSLSGSVLCKGDIPAVVILVK